MRDTPRRANVYRSRIAIQYDRRDAPMQAFAELLAVIIRTAIVVVINQSLIRLPALLSRLVCRNLCRIPCVRGVRDRRRNRVRRKRTDRGNDINFALLN